MIYVTYTVKRRDTLWAISKKYSCTVAEIVALNGKLITDPDLILLDGNLKYQKNNYHKARQAVCHKKSIMRKDLSSVVIVKEYEKQNNVEKYQCFCLLLRLIIY